MIRALPFLFVAAAVAVVVIGRAGLGRVSARGDDHLWSTPHGW